MKSFIAIPDAGPTSRLRVCGAHSLIIGTIHYWPPFLLDSAVLILTCPFLASSSLEGLRAPLCGRRFFVETAKKQIDRGNAFPEYWKSRVFGDAAFSVIRKSWKMNLKLSTIVKRTFSNQWVFYITQKKFSTSAGGSMNFLYQRWEFCTRSRGGAANSISLKMGSLQWFHFTRKKGKKRVFSTHITNKESENPSKKKKKKNPGKIKTVENWSSFPWKTESFCQITLHRKRQRIIKKKKTR